MIRLYIIYHSNLFPFHKNFYTKDLDRVQTKDHYDANVVSHTGPEADRNSFILLLLSIFSNEFLKIFFQLPFNVMYVDQHMRMVMVDVMMER